MTVRHSRHGDTCIVTIITDLVFMVCIPLFRRGLIGELAASRIGKTLGIRADT